MLRRALWLAPVLLGLAVPASAQRFTNMYDRETLAHWQRLTPDDIRWNFENVVIPVLTAAERRALAGTRLDFPLLGEPSAEPWVYAAFASPPTVQMSMLSLRFFGDLALAYSWLWANGYSTATVSEYLGMLKYRSAGDFPGGRLPRPLDALRIPAGVRDHPKTMDVFNKAYKSAVVFVLAHELGHLYHRHPGYRGGDFAAFRRNEGQADAFAVEVMRRIGVAPAGMALFFTFLAHLEPSRWDFASEAEYQAHLARATHPVTADRLRTLAALVRADAEQFARTEPDPVRATEQVRTIATEIARIGDLLEDQGALRLLRFAGRTTDLAALAPRRPGELPLQSRASGGGAAAFDGVYDGRATDASGGGPLRVVLRRTGDRVVGEFTYGPGNGRVQGLVQGERLDFTWELGGATGRGVLRLTEGGNGFRGTWGYGQSREDGGGWSGRAVPRR